MITQRGFSWMIRGGRRGRGGRGGGGGRGGADDVKATL